MNKPLKFRAWDNVTDKMHYVGESYEIAFGFDSTGIVAWDLTTDEQNLNELCHLVYMQSTGLKDKNGTEIYEGDIIKNTQGYLEKVVFANGSFQTSSIKYPNANLYLLNTYNDYIEVIGNIFQDKNLLEVE